MKESKFVKTKIVAGYLLLIAVCILSVGYVYRVVVRFSAPDDSYALLHTKRSAVNRTLYHLYQAESYGQLMIAGYQSYEARYKRELRTVRASIDSLRALTAAEDSLQTMRLDSITRLIADKERRTMSLRSTMRAGSTAGLLDKNIRELIAPREGIMADTTPFRSVVKQDTVAVPRAKRRFMQRLGDLFSPPKEDSSVVISRREVVGAMMPAEAVKDTIALVLRSLQDSVTSNRLSIYDRAWQEGLRLSYSNELVNTKIYRLIMDFEAEDTAYLMQRIERNEALRRRSSRLLGGVAIGAVVLMLLFVGMLWRDINRSNRYRRELEQANRDKEALLAAREKLMLAVTHDIKAPLGSVTGYIDLLSRLTDDKRQELYLGNMRESAEHLLALVNSLLDFYRLDINKTEVNRVVFHPAQLFETIRAGFAAAAAAKGLDLRLEAEPAAAGEVTGDAFHIRQIADNLISNALKFTDKGSVTLRVDVVGGRLVFSVRDTGRGIGREEKERIFAEFVRLSSARGVDGFGLGLSIVDRLVKLLDGTISLESRPGEGSKFIVSLPVGEAGKGAAASDAVQPDPIRTGLRVLLVDDDPLQLEMTAAMCSRAGIGAESCPYPEYAGKLVGEGRFDLVLTDIQMPSADGFSVLEAVRGVDPSIGVIAVSARGDMDAAGFADRGFAGCLRKPFTYTELIAAIRAACDAAGAESAERSRSEQPPADRIRAEQPLAEHSPAGHSPVDRIRAERSLAERSLAESSGMDFSPLTAYAGDDAEAARSILRSFAEQTAANCTELEKALAEGDWTAVKALAHKMLPVFTMLGAETVAGVLRLAEVHEGPLTDGLCGELLAAAEKIRSIAAEAEKAVVAKGGGSSPGE